MWIRGVGKVTNKEENQFMELYNRLPGVTLFVRNFTKPGGRSPCFKVIVPGEKDGFGLDKALFMRMDRLFEILQLDLQKLSQIFVKEPWNYYTKPRAKRFVQQTAPSYSELGTCRAIDDEGWIELAKLMQKNILQIHELGGNPPEYPVRAIYYSDGRFSIIDPDTWFELEFVDDIDMKILTGQIKPQISLVQ
ncbi:MAG: hypothetical protein HYT61_00850 [Candidatus Yanofskybacteria bacterium]|nr:hypothetical protein [Candidatus Yanofskybacteria bacterium]